MGVLMILQPISLLELRLLELPLVDSNRLACRFLGESLNGRRRGDYRHPFDSLVQCRLFDPSLSRP